MVHCAPGWSTVCLTVLLACSAVVHSQSQQSLRVAQDAREIRAFRLIDEHLPKLRKVAETLSRGFQPTPERPRADAAMFTVLSMSLAYNEPSDDRMEGAVKAHRHRAAWVPGIRLPSMAPLLHFAKRQDMVAWPLREVAAPS